MSFSILPEEIKIEILNYLSIGSRYNASLVWQETMDETRRFIPTNEEVLEMLKVGANEYIRYGVNSEEDDDDDDDTYFRFETLEDLERAGVEATAGHLNSVRHTVLEGIDVTSLPTNIVNSLFKIATGLVEIRGVKGLKFSMLNNIECLELELTDIKIPNFNKNLAPWAASKNWTVAKLAVGYEFKRSVIST